MNLDNNILTAETPKSSNSTILEKVQKRVPSDRKVLDFIIKNLGYF